MRRLFERVLPQRHRIRTPTVLQMEAVECGAAALGIVLAHYGKFLPLEELRLACGVSRDGSKASNVVRAARSYGMEAAGYRWDIDKVRAASLPVIVFWNFNHFLVVEGFHNGKVYLNDPAEGPRVVTEEEFDEGFTGVVLDVRPGDGFEKGGYRPSTLVALREIARGSESAVLFAFLAGTTLVVPGVLLPAFIQVFVDKILLQGLRDWYRPLLMGMALTFGIRAGVGLLQEVILLRLRTKISVATSGRFLWHILRLPAEFFSQRYGGEVSSRLALNDQVASFLSGRIAQSGIDSLLVVFYLVLMLTYDWLLALVAVAAVALIIAATVSVNRRRVDANRRLLQEQGKALGTVMGGLSTIETVKASGTETELFARWAGYNAKYLNASQELGRVTQIFLTLPPALTSLATVAVLSLGSLRVIDGTLTVGMLVAFQSLLASFLGPVNNLVSATSSLQEMEGQINRIQDVLRYEVDPEVTRDAAVESGPEGVGDEGAAKLDGRLELAGMTFGYSRMEKPLLDELDMALAPGRRIALVGPSGCGKSTVAKLVAGLYAPWAGEVLFDGRPRSAHGRRLLANSMAMVDQDITLFQGTVRENLTLWDPTVPEAALVRACRDACIHDDIVARPGGYDGPVEEGGSNFSGGQRQRLEIARALVTNPRILVLDEATSALDANTEQIVDANLRRRGCTCVVIAHRLSTIRDADEILVLKKGKVVQRGTHEDLMMHADGLYATLAREA